MIKELYTSEQNGIKTFEIYFTEDINQEEDEPLNSINESIRDLFSFGLREYQEVEIDWRDPRTVEVRIVDSE